MVPAACRSFGCKLLRFVQRALCRIQQHACLARFSSIALPVVSLRPLSFPSQIFISFLPPVAACAMTSTASSAVCPCPCLRPRPATCPLLATLLSGLLAKSLWQWSCPPCPPHRSRHRHHLHRHLRCWAQGGSKRSSNPWLFSVFFPLHALFFFLLHPLSAVVIAPHPGICFFSMVCLLAAL